jgi:hypothetical protein
MVGRVLKIMMRTHVFTAEELTTAFKRAKVGDKFLVAAKEGKSRESEQNRVYSCASCAGRQIVMRKYRDGWKATILE